MFNQRNKVWVKPHIEYIDNPVGKTILILEDMLEKLDSHFYKGSKWVMLAEILMIS